jgi:hypothetical protein
VDLTLARPAHDVAAGRWCRQAARKRHPGLRGVQLGQRGVQHHLQLTDVRLEALLEPRAGELELGEHALGVRRVAHVVARHERL